MELDILELEEMNCPKCKSDNTIKGADNKLRCLDCRYIEGEFEGI